MKKIKLYPHGGSGNHGCEALVRTIASKFQKDSVVLFSSRKQEDYKYGVDKLCSIEDYNGNVKRFSFNYFKLAYRYYIKKDKIAFDITPYYSMLKEIKRNDIAVSFGGDNYCYDGMIYQLKLINRELDSKKINRVLWGASIENINGIEDDLKGYKIITIRESLSYEMVKKINPNTYLMPDPAFNLPLEICDEISFDNPKGYVGINLSPLIIESEKKEGIVFNNYYNLVKYILEYTDMTILLIPHVVWKENDDREALNKLKECFDSNRIILSGDNNCMKQKYIISKCKFMIAARTHASIAAYSTGIPTLVVGYSIKAKGIAKDLFGTWENYVIPAQGMKTDLELVENFKWLQSKEDEILNLYKDILPTYLENAKKGMEDMKNMIQEL